MFVNKYLIISLHQAVFAAAPLERATTASVSFKLSLHLTSTKKPTYNINRDFVMTNIL
jgi:hypothetical protein